VYRDLFDTKKILKNEVVKMKRSILEYIVVIEKINKTISNLGYSIIYSCSLFDSTITIFELLYCCIFVSYLLILLYELEAIVSFIF
jgi:hypothetical protein